MIIALTGFMGCGKSRIGNELSRLLSIPVVDLDKYIEKKTGRSVRQIFEIHSEQVFRQMELSALQEICSRIATEGDIILSLGGGTLTTEECARIVRENALCIYLRATTDTLVSHLKGNSAKRPMLKGATDEKSLREKIENLMKDRSAVYEKTAHIIIDTDGLNALQIAWVIQREVQRSEPQGRL